MMDSYIDEKYFIHFFKSLKNVVGDFSDEEDARRDMLKFFKGKTNICLDTNFDNVLNGLDVNTKAIASILVNQFTTGRNGTKVKSGQADEFKHLKYVDLYSRLRYPFVSFWLGESYEHSLEIYSENNPYYFISKDDDVIKWNLFSRSKIFNVNKDADPDDDCVLSSWNQIKKFAHPFRDILICDRFAFNSKKGIKLNIIPLIVNLASDINKIENILIFTKKKERNANHYLVDSNQDVYDIIKHSLNEKGINSNLKIHEFTKIKGNHNNIHGRNVLTNNLFIKADDSFDFFWKNGKYKTNGATLDIKPLFDANQSELSLFLKDVKHIKLNARESMRFGEMTENMLDLI